MDRFYEPDFEVESLVGRPFHPRLGFGQKIDGVKEPARFEEPLLPFQGLSQIRGYFFARIPGIDFGDEKIAEMSDEIGQEDAEIFPRLAQAHDPFEGAGGVLFQDQPGDSGNGFGGIEPENLKDVGLRNGLSAESDQLIQH